MPGKQRGAQIDSKEYPYFYFFRVTFAPDTVHRDLFITTDQDDYYLLKRLWVKWPKHGFLGEDDPLVLSPSCPLAIEINYSDQGRRLQNEPIPAQLISSPCEADYVVTPNSPYPVMAGQRKIAFTFNYLFDKNGTINIRVSYLGQSYFTFPGGDGELKPVYFELMAEGRKIPGRALPKRTRSAGVTQ